MNDSLHSVNTMLYIYHQNTYQFSAPVYAPLENLKPLLLCSAVDAMGMTIFYFLSTQYSAFCFLYSVKLFFVCTNI